jgi:hypothetical protein
MRHDFDRTGTAMKHHELTTEEGAIRALRSLPTQVPPVGLTTSLRVIASRERQRRLQTRTWGQAFKTWYERSCMLMNELMPLALPFAGGVASAVVLFSAWLVPTYPSHTRGGMDVPTMLTTEATLKGTEPMSVSGSDGMVDVTVDNQGHMVDYDIVSDAVELQDAAVRRRLDSFLFYTKFDPATAFGRPTAGTVRVPIYASKAQGEFTWSKKLVFVTDVKD